MNAHCVRAPAKQPDMPELGYMGDDGIVVGDEHDVIWNSMHGIVISVMEDTEMPLLPCDSPYSPSCDTREGFAASSPGKAPIVKNPDHDQVSKEAPLLRKPSKGCFPSGTDICLEFSQSLNVPLHCKPPVLFKRRRGRAEEAHRIKSTFYSLQDLQELQDKEAIRSIWNRRIGALIHSGTT